MLEGSSVDVQAHREVTLVVNPHAHIHGKVAVLPADACPRYSAGCSRQASLDSGWQGGVDIMACAGEARSDYARRVPG